VPTLDDVLTRSILTWAARYRDEDKLPASTVVQVTRFPPPKMGDNRCHGCRRFSLCWFFLVAFLFATELRQATQIASAQEHPAASVPNTEPHKSFWQRTTEDPVVLYTLVLSVFTGLLVVVTGGLIWVGWRQVRLTRGLAERQIRDTKILQRAYLTVEPGGLLLHPDRDDRLRCFVTYHNVGHLPARNVRWYATVWPDGRDADYSVAPHPDFDYNRSDGFPIGELKEGSIVLSSGEKSSQWVATMFTYRFSNSAFVWGLVTYDDGFGKTRHTRFCHHYRLKEYIGRKQFTIPGEQASLHQFGNEAD
jgi:hypothetical protein